MMVTRAWGVVMLAFSTTAKAFVVEASLLSKGRVRFEHPTSGGWESAPVQTAAARTAVPRTPRMTVFEAEEGTGGGSGRGGGIEIDIEGKGPQGYTDVSVREAVEWTMGKDSEFTYIDVRSAEEHEKLATVRGATCIPAFEIVMPEASESPEEEGQEATEEDGTVFAPDYNFEDLDYTVKPDFIETMKAQFSLDAKLLIGCKTARSAKACELLVDAGFTQVYNVESQVFMRTRAPQVWS